MSTIRILICGVALLLAAAAPAPAQTAPNAVMFHWGGVHFAPGEALAFNLELTNHFGGPLTVSAELRLEDKNGNVVYTRALDVSDGHAVSFAIGPDIRSLRNIAADIYGAIGPEPRLLQPCLKVIWPPGPTTPVDRMSATLEVMDPLGGRVVTVSGNPRAIIGVLAQ